MCLSASGLNGRVVTIPRITIAIKNSPKAARKIIKIYFFASSEK